MRVALGILGIVVGSLLAFGELAFSVLLLLALAFVALRAITHLLRGFFPWAYENSGDDDFSSS